MKLISLFILFLLYGCSVTSFQGSSGEIKKRDTTYFNYVDQTGKLRLKREYKIQGNKFVSRTKLFGKSTSNELESTVAISKLGTLKGKGKKSILPEVSQFKVWFDKKEYFSQIKLQRKRRSLDVISKSPEEKWNFQKEYPLPSGKYFCFFSQLPECLKLQNLLLEAARKNVQVFVIWENFPYHNEIYEGIEDSPFVSATLKLDKHSEKELKYSLDIGNQLIIYKFDKDLNFLGLFWISQGISAEPVDKER